MKKIFTLAMFTIFTITLQAQEVNFGRAGHIIGDIYPTDDGYWIHEMEEGRYSEIFKISYDGEGLTDTLPKIYLDIDFIFNKYAFIGEDEDKNMYFFRYDEYTGLDDSLFLFKYDKVGTQIWSKAIDWNSGNSLYITSAILYDSTINIDGIRFDDDDFTIYEQQIYNLEAELMFTKTYDNVYGFGIKKSDLGLLGLRTEIYENDPDQYPENLVVLLMDDSLNTIKQADLGPDLFGLDLYGSDIENILITGATLDTDNGLPAPVLLNVNLEDGTINWQKDKKEFPEDTYSLNFKGKVYEYDDHFLVSYNLEGDIDDYRPGFIMKYSKDGTVEEKILDMADVEGYIAFSATRLKGDFLHYGGHILGEQSVYGKIDLSIINNTLDIAPNDVKIFGSSQILNIKGMEEYDILSVRLLNTVGQEIEASLAPFEHDKYQYNVPFGLYIVQVETEDGSLSKLVYLK